MFAKASAQLGVRGSPAGPELGRGSAEPYADPLGYAYQEYAQDDAVRSCDHCKQSAPLEAQTSCCHRPQSFGSHPTQGMDEYYVAPEASSADSRAAGESSRASAPMVEFFSREPRRQPLRVSTADAASLQPLGRGSHPLRGLP